MALILSLDNLLKLASTESALGLDLVFNYEMMIGGGATLLVGLLAGAPAYGQTKFNVLNYGITHSTERRFPSVINAAFCGLLFFLGFPVLNVIPRFILAALLVFAGAGFLIENLIDAYARYSKMSFLGIWLIFMINMFGELWQALLPASMGGGGVRDPLRRQVRPPPDHLRRGALESAVRSAARR